MDTEFCKVRRCTRIKELMRLKLMIQFQSRNHDDVDMPGAFEREGLTFHISPLPVNAACSWLHNAIASRQDGDENDPRIVQTFTYSGNFASSANEDPTMWRYRLKVRPPGSPLAGLVMGLNCKDGETFFEIQMP